MGTRRRDHRITVSLNPEYHAALKRAAGVLQKSQSELVNEIVGNAIPGILELCEAVEQAKQGKLSKLELMGSLVGTALRQFSRSQDQLSEAVNQATKGGDEA
ncbi:MAG: hypothetical protein D6712_20040 [Chloroflexi bacterium]|nr:MAG: hypothetical protein D6712_20040 [Chloroflexota bacterium]